MIYKLINEDNTLVNEYPAPQIYKTLSDEEKNNIYSFKKEIEKITIPKGLGKVYVNVMYDCIQLEKEYILMYSNGHSREYYEKEIEKIYRHMESFSKKNNLFDFYLGCHILLMDWMLRYLKNYKKEKKSLFKRSTEEVYHPFSLLLSQIILGTIQKGLPLDRFPF